MKRRVVVTGVGLVTPLGCGTDDVFKKVLNGVSGITSIDNNAINNMPRQCPVTAAARVPRNNNNDGNIYDSMFDSMVNKSSHNADFIKYALCASDIALMNANIISDNSTSTKVIDSYRAGVAIGNGGIGSLSDITNAHDTISSGSYRRLSPYFVPKILVNMAAGQVSIRHQLKGPVHSVATACAAGAHSVGDAFNFIRLGYADMMLAGGTDASIDGLGISGFARMKALGLQPSLSDDSETIDGEKNLAEKISKPFHRDRNGFVIGEGAAVLILEELESALLRGAREQIIAEVCGYGLSGDAFHATAPSSDGDGAQRCMKIALQDAGIDPSQIGYINAHATSTPTGDAVEICAIEQVFSSGNRKRSNPLYVSSTKGATGHLLGAAGAVEAAFTVLALKHNKLPPTLNLDSVGDIDPDLTGSGTFQHVLQKDFSYPTNLDYALKNSFGFGGTNASLVFGKYKD